MDAVRRRVTKFRDHVLLNLSKAPQSQGIASDSVSEMQRRAQQLEGLYMSTRAAKYFQREIVKGVESYITASSKQLEACKRLAEECIAYAMEGPNPRWPLSQASYLLGKLYLQKEKKRESLHHALRTQVLEPLRSAIASERLDNARALCQRYDTMRNDAESKAAMISRKKAKLGEPSLDEYRHHGRRHSTEDAETKLDELRSALSTLGKEAAMAMSSVESQQQRLTLERLIAMVRAERGYHEGAAAILQRLEMQMVSGVSYQHDGTSSTATSSPDRGRMKVANGGIPSIMPPGGPYLAEVIHAFDAQTPGELSLRVGDIVAVRQESSNGWSEGECRGQCGWFPASHVKRRDKVPISRLESGFSLERPISVKRKAAGINDAAIGR